jgi:hypothetical protein
MQAIKVGLFKIISKGNYSHQYFFDIFEEKANEQKG